MNSVLLAEDKARLGIVLPALDPDRFRYTVADFANPALVMAGFDCIVPFQLKDHYDLWARSDFDQLNCLIPPVGLMQLLDNKYDCNRFLAARGFGALVPPMLDGADSATAWPVIYKKRQDAFGNHSFLCHSPEELDAFEAATVRTEYFTQEYVPGAVEYATHMLSVAGRVLYHSTFRYTFDTAFYVKGRRYEPPLPEACACPCPAPLVAILAEFEYTGTCCFNYKVSGYKMPGCNIARDCGTNEPKIFEINPRFGHSLAYDINNYLDAYIDALRAGRR